MKITKTELKQIIKEAMEFKMKLQDLMKELAIRDIDTSIHYDKASGQFFLDLETMAKSELHLYESGLLRGRYEYQKEINLGQNVEGVLSDLCDEFQNAMHNKDSGSQAWKALCKTHL